jgi:hypothetical protein
MSDFRLLAATVAPSLLAALVAGFAPQPVRAATLTVTNCNDSGAGSLRRAVSNALSGDTIDMTALTCNRILMGSGWITVAQDDLTLVGRGRFELTLDGNDTVRIFRHTGAGTLRIERMSLANGRYRGRGGCILSEIGNVELVRSRVHHCHVDGAVTSGGGIAAQGNVSLSYSSVFANSTATFGPGAGIAASHHVTLDHSQVYGNVGGGGAGILAGGLTANYSLIHNNRGTGAAATVGNVFDDSVTINKSTISNNITTADPRFSSTPSGGGLSITAAGGLLIIDSTISGNRAPHAAALSTRAATRIINSTIAFNHDTDADPIDHQCVGAIAGAGMRLENSIVARNTCGAGPAWDIDFAVLEGSNNLIEWSKSNVPADTILYTDPRLAPLADNGGPTRTHMLLADSPAIDRGDNDFNRAFDQRGPGFARVKGAFADIGAIER